MVLSLRTFMCTAVFCALFGNPAQAAKVGDLAPAFSADDSHGKKRQSQEFKGKFVVLEWHNRDCPYVKKHYAHGNMQKLQKQWTQKNVAWLTVISSAKGKQGYVDANTVNQDMEKAGAAPTAVLLDNTGAVGKAFGAKTTPHMFIIDPQGKLIYNGALDDKPHAEAAADVSAAKNYVAQALTEATAGRPVSEPVTQPYGCGVKYP